MARIALCDRLPCQGLVGVYELMHAHSCNSHTFMNNYIGKDTR